MPKWLAEAFMKGNKAIKKSIANIVFIEMTNKFRRRYFGVTQSNGDPSIYAIHVIRKKESLVALASQVRGGNAGKHRASFDRMNSSIYRFPYRRHIKR